VRVLSHPYIHVCVYVLCDEGAAQGGKVGEKCTKEGGMRAEVGTNAKSFNEFE